MMSVKRIHVSDKNAIRRAYRHKQISLQIQQIIKNQTTKKGII